MEALKLKPQAAHSVVKEVINGTYEEKVAPEGKKILDCIHAIEAPDAIKMVPRPREEEVRERKKGKILVVHSVMVLVVCSLFYFGSRGVYMQIRGQIMTNYSNFSSYSLFFSLLEHFGDAGQRASPAQALRCRKREGRPSELVRFRTGKT